MAGKRPGDIEGSAGGKLVGDDHREQSTGRPRPVTFLVLVTVLSLPFFLLGAVTDGVRIGALELPPSALMFTLPVIAAGILTSRDNSAAGVVLMLRRAYEPRHERPGIWSRC